MGCALRGSMRIPGLLLALLLALAVVSAVSLRLDPDTREKQLQEREHRREADDVERRHREDEEERRRDVERRRDEDDEERRREIERHRRDEDDDRRGRRGEVERRRRDEDEDDSRRERRREDHGRRREVEDDEERRRELERRRRDDDDEERRREMGYRRREGDNAEERRRDDVERRRREVDRHPRDDDESRRHEVERRRRDDDEDRRRDRRRSFQGEGSLQLQKPQKKFSSEGGDIRVWDNIRPLEESEVYVQGAQITLRERGLLLPQYSDSACVAFVEEGEGLVGLLSGYSLGEKARRVRRGDVVAVPKGIAHWWYNTGNQELRILALSDTSQGVLGERDYTPFALIGSRGEQGEEYQSILHGFRKEFLAEAWDADESEVQEVLESQKGQGIVKVERDVDIERAVNVIEEGDATATDNTGSLGTSHLEEFVYNVRHGTPDILVEDAGFFNSANRFKLPLLNIVRLGLTYGRLEKNAIFAPHWSPNGHQVVHILRGTAHLEIAGPGGQKLVNQKVQEGDVYVIPRFHAAGLRAEDEFEWVTFYTTDLPYVEALAGKTSVYKNLPVQVAAAAFNVDEERVREFRKRRLSDALLLPPHGRQELHHLRDDQESFEGSYLTFRKVA